VPAGLTSAYFQTKHEIQEAEITVPKVDQLAADEVLEKVGEVMNIVDSLAVVRGLPSEVLNRGSDRALDSDTLLVFDDRKVLGYVRFRLSLLYFAYSSFFFSFFSILIFATRSHSHKTRADLRNVWTNYTAVLSSQIQLCLPSRPRARPRGQGGLSCPHSQPLCFREPDKGSQRQ
jgi:hypothetical protein